MLEGLRRRIFGLIRAHEDSSIRLVIVTHLVLIVLDLNNRATFQTVTIDFKLLEVWAETDLWLVLSSMVVGWLLVWRTPPKVVWGLWASTAILATWGLINFTIGFIAERPVSLLGPALILMVAAPLSWTTADSLQERIESGED